MIAALDALQRRGQIILVRHRRNRGFPSSANEGIRVAAGRDVVLLNSDTLAAPGWLEALRSVAYSAPDIGTVTPLLLLGTAATWRFRDRRGLALIVAATVLTKLFLWPLLPWLWFTGRRRAAVQALVGVVVVTMVGWLPLGFGSMERYPSLLHQLSVAELL